MSKIVTSECLQRVLHFETEDAGGSCFSYEDGNKQYLITAKHIFRGVRYPSRYNVKFDVATGAIMKEVYIYYHKNENVDIAVMELVGGQVLTKTFTGQQYSQEGVIWGQDVYFLGFPYKHCRNLISPPTDNPIPFIKKATLSGMTKEDNVLYLLLDGINNPGFSGGPVCFWNGHNPSAPMAIAGVISSYEFNPLPIYDKDDNTTDSYVQENTGIVYATDISYALEIIAYKK